MKAQQLLDYIIKPTLEYMLGHYNSKNAQMLLLATAAIESQCGYYIKQVRGPALGIWQMEPPTEYSILLHSDALKDFAFSNRINALISPLQKEIALVLSPTYACAMARLKYSMDVAALPHYSNKKAIYAYYKRIYNTPLGASTFTKFCSAWTMHKLDRVKL